MEITGVKENDIMWRDIPSQRGQYQININGEVRNRYGRILKQDVHNGYKRLRLAGYSYKTYYIQSLMSETFFDGAKLTHINGDRGDNRLENLRPR